jgi:tetratricopeptide (TPR) repeat protein
MLGGCGKTPTQKEAAQLKWNQARAGVLASLAKSEYEKGNFDKARQTIIDAQKMDPDNVSLHILSARVSIETGQLESADKELALARTMDPKNAEAEYFAGIVCERWQKPAQAYEYYTHACEKNPKEAAYLLARVEMLVALNRTGEGVQLIKERMSDYEHNPAIYHTLGQLQADLKHYPEAVESLRQAALLAPDDALVREHLAMAMYFNHQYREAADMFSRLLKDPENTKRPELYVALGECQLQIGRADDARGSFETATSLNPGSTTAWLSLAKTALQLGDTRRAEIVLKKVMSIDGSCGEAHLMMGYLRLRQSKLEDALSEFQKSSALDREDPVSLCMIGYVLEKTGKPQQAVKYYSQALKIKPGDELATKLMASVDVGGSGND